MTGEGNKLIVSVKSHLGSWRLVGVTLTSPLKGKCDDIQHLRAQTTESDLRAFGGREVKESARLSQSAELSGSERTRGLNVGRFYFLVRFILLSVSIQVSVGLLWLFYSVA